MKNEMDTPNEYILEEIDKRYSDLAQGSCCLSCGKAAEYGLPKPGEVVVDIGSGRGTDVLKMAVEIGEKGFAYGIDIASGMIEKARKTAKKMGLTQVEFLHSPLDQLPLPDNHADLVISNCTINHAPNKDAVWQEIHRILKPGGRFVVSDIYATSPVPHEYATNPTAVAECWAGAVTKEEYLQTLLKTGFNEISILEESAPYPKGQIHVCSFTVYGKKQKKCCNCH